MIGFINSQRLHREVIPSL